jgi:hypothetical protein
MTDFNERTERAVDALTDLAAWPLDVVVNRANTALAEKQWPTAALLFQRASILAMNLATHALQQEVNLIRGEISGS